MKDTDLHPKISETSLMLWSFRILGVPAQRGLIADMGNLQP